MREGSLKIPGYQIFECTRPESKSGGGLLTAALNNLDPLLITKDKETEILVIQVNVNGNNIRIINGYGCQEDDDQCEILNFWQRLEEEIIEAKNEQCAIVIELDANAKLGGKQIKGDPNMLSNNGKIMSSILERQNLFVGNKLSNGKGVITRKRTLVDGTVEESVIDYILLCDKMVEFVEDVIIDENIDYVLKHLHKHKKSDKIITSDHNMLYCRFNIRIHNVKRTERTEVFNFKDSEGKRKFFEKTNLSDKLSSCFRESRCFEASSCLFIRELKGLIHQSFSKVRISNSRRHGGDRDIQIILATIIKVKNLSKRLTCGISKEIVTNYIAKLEQYVGELSANKNTKKVANYIEEITKEGEFNQKGFWKLKRKLISKETEPPMAKRDLAGNLIVSTPALKRLYLETYKNRLKHREMNQNLTDIYDLKMQLWKSRYKNIRGKKTTPWNIDNLNLVTKEMKNNKSIDPNGMVGELFKSECAGNDLKLALIQLFNGIKRTHLIPEYMKLSNITSLFKNKGSRQDLENDRGIFILPILKKMIEKLIYNDNYAAIDSLMSDSNIGARKKRNIRDHLFIIYAVINSVVKGSEQCIDIQIFDIEKCFDALWLEECLNDLYDTLPSTNHNDQLSLLYKLNETNLVAIKTPCGITERIDLPFIVQQGGTWGPLLCANTIDKIGRECGNDNVYLYKQKTSVLPLGFIDDLNIITKCGQETVGMNIYITTKIELKKLRFHTPKDDSGKSKCQKMHVGKKNVKCPNLKVHGHNVPEVSEITYLGDIISADGKNTKNVKNRINKGMGLLNQIFNIIKTVSFGTRTIEMALLLRNSIFINGILTNAETWYNLNKTEVEDMDKLDKLFFLKLLEVPRTTPVVAFYLELGVLPLSTIIKQRRILYLHHILTRPKSGMLYRVFITQWLYPCPGDWVLQIKEDLYEFDIPCDLDWISNKSKESFKRYVKEKVRESSLACLKTRKQRYKKLENLDYVTFETQKYLLDNNTSFEEKKIIFQFRTRMARFGENFKAGKARVICPMCRMHFDCQFSAPRCPRILKHVGELDIMRIFDENIPVQTVKKMVELLKFREAYKN